MTKCQLSFQQKWIVLIAAAGINLSMGVNYSWSIFKKALVEDLSWSNLHASLPYTLYIVVFAFTMAFAGRMQDKYGPRLVVIIGSILLGTGYVLCSFADGVVPFLLAYGLLGGMGNSFCYSTTTPTAIKWFSYEKRGTVTGIIIGATSLASFINSPFASVLIANYGVSSTFLIIGVTMFLIIFCFGRFMKNPDSNEISNDPMTVSLNTSMNASSREYAWREMLRTRVFYKIWIMNMFASSAGLMIIGNITTIAQIQAKWNLGYYLVMTIAIFNTVGRLGSGILSDKYGRKIIILSALLIQSLNMVCFIRYTNPSFLIFGAALTGLCYGAAVAFFPLAVADFYGVKNAGANYGFILSAWGVAGVLGPVLAGWLVDITGAYGGSYLVSALLLVLALVLASTIKQDSQSHRLIL